MDGVRVSRSLVIPGDELRLSFSPSGGPGGQHANKASTRVELSWNITESRALGPRQRSRLLAALRSRIDSSGTLRLSSDRHRSQMRNREEVRARLSCVVADALKPPKPRRATVPTHTSRERRLAHKKQRSEIKRRRRRPASGAE